MAEFLLKVNTDNAAFDPPCPEIARVLAQVAAMIQDEGEAAFVDGLIRIRDYNGNRVGFAAYTFDEE